MTGVIYARYSSDNQREESIDGQIRECRAFAKRNDIHIVGTYIDRALSAKTDNRPDFQKMIKDSSKHEFDCIIVWKLDRFARNRYDSAHYKNILKKNNVRVISATEAISQGAEGILLESVLEGMAEYYSVELAEKINRGLTENALKCKYNGGSLALGYTTDKEQNYHINPDTAPIVREIFERYKAGMTQGEIAKALIIDSAIGWKEFDSEKANYIGFGLVPIKIEDIINSKNDEIKFYISGESNLYDTYTHNIPVPLHQDKYPFIAKATLCYFPECTRNQGVDYTNTELDFYFGRIDNKGLIKSINENHQSEGETQGVTEEDARRWYRKWDNVKHINQMLKSNIKPKQRYDNVMWGLSIKAKDRLESRQKGIKFGVVITLKEINGVNRVDEFINQCSLRGWLVNKVNVENRINVYNIAQEEIEFE